MACWNHENKTIAYLYVFQIKLYIIMVFASGVYIYLNIQAWYIKIAKRKNVKNGRNY